MTLTPRAKFCIALTSGGACAVGAPVALHYTKSAENQTPSLNEKSTEIAQVGTTENVQSETSNVESPQTSRSRTRRDLGSQEEAHASSEEQVSSQNDREQNDIKFEELWTKITNGYQAQQKENKKQSENKFSFKTELKNILTKTNSFNSEWEIQAEEYKDCSSISGGKTDYCAFLKLKNGSEEYRLKIDRYGKGGNNKRWDVTVVLKNGSSSVKWYSKQKSSWETKSTDIDKFQGSSQQSNNWWSTLDQKSIEV